MSETDKNKLIESGSSDHSRVVFHLIDPNVFESDNAWIGYYSVGSLFRLLIPEIFSELKKIIYLDADILFLKDIAELWNIDITEYALAGCHDIGFENGIIKPKIVKENYVKLNEYINSGVLVMNLTNIKQKGRLLDLVNEFMREHSDTFLPDQDALNYIFANNILLLSSEWNCFTRYERMKTREINNYVYHFMGQSPNNSDLTEFDKLYYHYQGLTPWGNELLEKQLVNSLNFAYDKINVLQMLLSKVANKKNHVVYYGFETLAMRSIQEMIGFREQDYFVGEFAVDEKGYWRGCERILKEEFLSSKREDVVILLLPDADNGKAIDIIQQLGYRMCEDFFVVPRVLVAKQGGYWC